MLQLTSSSSSLPLFVKEASLWPSNPTRSASRVLGCWLVAPMSDLGRDVHYSDPCGGVFTTCAVARGRFRFRSPCFLFALTPRIPPVIRSR